jgi:hypothetical protein
VSTAPTAAVGTNTTQIATTAFAQTNLGTRPLATTAPGAGALIGWTGTTWAPVGLTSGQITSGLGYTPLNPANNLSDVAVAATALTNLGGAPTVSPTFTGTITAAAGNFSGTVAFAGATTAVTQASADSSTNLATTQFVHNVATGGGLPLTGGTLSGPLVVNLNTAAAQAPLAGTALQISGGDGVVARLELDAYANALGGAANVLMRTTRGTSGTPAVALSAGDLIGGIVYRGHNGTAYSAANRATINCVAAETWNTSTPTESTLLTFSTTTLGSTTLAERLHIQAGLQVYNAAGAPTGGDQGAGTINVAGTGTAGAPAYLLNGVAQGRINASVAWIAGANPNNGFLYRADAPRTIVSAIGVVTASAGAAGPTVSIRLIPSTGGAGTLIHSGSMDANGAAMASGDQPFALTTTAMAAGDRLILNTSGTWGGSNVSAGGIQVTLQ